MCTRILASDTGWPEASVTVNSTEQEPSSPLITGIGFLFAASSEACARRVEANSRIEKISVRSSNRPPRQEQLSLSVLPGPWWFRPRSRPSCHSAYAEFKLVLFVAVPNGQISKPRETVQLIRASAAKGLEVVSRLAF